MTKTPKETCCIIPSSLKELRYIERMTQRIARGLCFSEDQRSNLAIAVTEAVGNAIVHGNKLDPTKKVTVAFRLENDRIRVSIQDEGKGFNPNQLANPLDPQNLMKEHGRGIFILKNIMDEVHYSFSPQGTTIHMTMNKRRKNG
jgi:serine/threonine-protein kinase RsbW